MPWYVAVTNYSKRRVADSAQRFHGEVNACNLLHDEDVHVVPFVGVYSTETHPFGLVYKYVDGLDLKQYLRNGPTVWGLQMVLIPAHPHCWPSDTS